MAAARVLVTPRTAKSSHDRVARTAAVGNVLVTIRPGVVTVSPKQIAMRSGSVVAALIETCCPQMARTLTSNPSMAPGTRSLAGRPRACETHVMGRGSQATSTSQPPRWSTVDPACASVGDTTTCRVDLWQCHDTLTHPTCTFPIDSSERLRKCCPWSMYSTPGISRLARKVSSVSQA